jgi:ribosomal protein L37AE/L43A
MTPQRTTNGALIDLLDRVLDKGLVIHADVIVSVAGIPLIGVNLRAALAGMETMLKYGIMQAWDEKSRAWEREHRKKKKVGVIAGETVRLRMLGAFYSKEGIYAAWRYACFYLTDERLLLYHQDFNEILFEVPLDKIQGLTIMGGKRVRDERVKEELHLHLAGGEACRLTALDVPQLKRAIEERMEETETCPQCGKRALIKVLLEEGCGACGWSSPSKNYKNVGIEALS